MSNKKKLYRIIISDHAATVDRTYEVLATSEEEAIEKYKRDEHEGCVEEEVTEWDSGHEDDWTIDEAES